MSEFGPAIAKVLEAEGGYANDPDDRGGPTNWGISTLFVRREGLTAEDLEIPDLTAEGFRHLTQARAVEIYRRCWWERYQYHRLDDQTVATKVFDFAVNASPARAHVLAQQAANQLGQSLVVDGRLGPLTVMAINACGRLAFLQTFGEQMAAYYRALVEMNPSQRKFLNNWLSRARWPGLILRQPKPASPDPHATPKS